MLDAYIKGFKLIIPKVKVIQKGDSVHFDVQLNTLNCGKTLKLSKVQSVRIQHGEYDEILFNSADPKYYYKEVPYKHVKNIDTFLYISTLNKEYKFNCGEIYWEHLGED